MISGRRGEESSFLLEVRVISPRSCRAELEGDAYEVQFSNHRS